MKSRSRPTAAATPSTDASKDAFSENSIQAAPLPISQQTIEQIGQLLNQLPKKEKDSWSIREAIAYLSIPITAALSKGYSRKEIATMIRAAGIPVSETFLKYQLSQLRAENLSTSAAKTTSTRRLRSKITTLSDRTTAFSPSINVAAHFSNDALHASRDTVEDVISYLISDT